MVSAAHNARARDQGDLGSIRRLVMVKKPGSFRRACSQNIPTALASEDRERFLRYCFSNPGTTVCSSESGNTSPSHDNVGARFRDRLGPNDHFNLAFETKLVGERLPFRRTSSQYNWQALISTQLFNRQLRNMLVFVLLNLQADNL